MRFAIVGSRGYPSTYSGYETLVRHLAPHLRDAGHDVTVYGRHAGRGYRVTEIDGLRIVETPAMDSKSLSSPSAAVTSLHHASRENYDAVLAVNLVTAPALVALQRGGTPVALNTDGLEWRRGKWGGVAKLTFYGCAVLAAKRIHHLISDSKAIQAFYEEQFGASSHFIPYGGDLREIAETDRLAEQGLEPDSYLLVVARLIPENSIDLILDAYEQAAPPLPLVIVGDANYESDLGRRLERVTQDGGGRVKALGHVSDQELLTQLWAHCRGYLHGHSVGGTNPSLLQALGLGAPTLALDTSFNREVLEPHTDSLFPDDAGELGRMMDAVARGTLHPVGGSDARDIVRQRYSWEQVLGDYTALLEDISRAPGSATRSSV